VLPSQIRCKSYSLCKSLFSFMLAIVFALPLIATPHYALAQVQQRETLFQWLFGPKEPPRRATRPAKVRPKVNQRPRNRTANVRRSNTNQTTPSIVRKRTAVPAPVVKLDNAKAVLVAGDFMANALGDGLSTRFQTNAGIQIETKANGSSGLVRTDYYDWFTRLPEFVDAAKPTITVVMIGSNDRQTMTAAGRELRFGSDEWFTEYERRLASIADIAKRNGSKLLWVGLPAYQSTNFTADVLVLNRLYRSAAEKAGGEFIDIWDGFADEAGKFITTGFDVNGQQARLRDADGIALTAAGREKLAFYVERVIRRYIDEAPPGQINLDGSNLPALSSLPDAGANPAEIRTQPISITDPELDGGAELLGSKPQPIVIAETPRQRLIIRGVMDEAPLGRVDDYRMDETNIADKAAVTP
jgi:hypothetical protein